MHFRETMLELWSHVILYLAIVMLETFLETREEPPNRVHVKAWMDLCALQGPSDKYTFKSRSYCVHVSILASVEEITLTIWYSTSIH